MIVAEAVSTLFFAAMAFAHAPMMMILLAFGSALADVPFFTASRAAIPNLVDTPDDISWANSLVTMGVHAGIAVGPLVGGVLLATIGASWVFGLNAVSFLVSVCLTLTVRGSYQERRDEDHDEHTGLVSGMALLWRARVMRRMTVAWFVFVLGMGMGMVADAALAEHFGSRPWGSRR
jgi:MFS family permease